MPARSTALMCTNTSFDPSAGWMNPKPFWLLKNFTVPVGIDGSLLVAPVHPARADRAADKASEFWEMTGEAPKIGSVARQAENRGCGALSIGRPPARQTAPITPRARVGFAWRRARDRKSRS